MKKLFLTLAPLLLPLVAVAQTPVTLNGTTYSTVANPVLFGGPTGTLALALQDTSSTGRANASNPPYPFLNSYSNTFISSGYSWNGAFSNAANGANLAEFQGATCLNAAVAWWAAGGPSQSPIDPNGYLAMAIACVDHAEDYMDGAMGCDTSKAYCGRAASWDGDWAGDFVWKMAMTYDIVHSQLTSGEISAFANKVLNDNDTSHGGIDTAACTPQPQTAQAGTLSSSTSSSTITGVGTSFTSLAVGGVLLMPNNINSSAPTVLGFISSIGSDTSITLTSHASHTNSGISFEYSPAWNNNCGLIWYLKHMDMAPLLTPTQATYYPANGAQSIAGPLSNLTYPHVVSYFAFGLVLAGDDPRAQTLVTQAYNYFLTQENNFSLSSFEGFPEEGGAYPHARQSGETALLLGFLQNAVVSPPAIGGTLVKRWAQEFYLAPFPYSHINQSAYGDGQNRYYQLEVGPGNFEANASYLLGSSPEGQYLNYFAFSSTANGGRGDWNSAGGIHAGSGYNLAQEFVYMPSPANTALQADYRTLPTQFIFNQTDTATCTSLGLTCAQLVPGIYTYMVSKSDWTSTATEVLVNAGSASAGFDHMAEVNPGGIHIYRNAPLLAGDGGCSGTGANGCDTGDGVTDSIIGLGTPSGAGSYANNIGGNTTIIDCCGARTSEATVSRWAGTVPTGDSSSRYAYEMIDLTHAYTSTVAPSRVQRHVIHFKKSSTQDYVVVYDDISVGTGELINTYWHYFVNSGAGTVSDGTNAITFTVGSTARLLTSFLPISANSIFMTDQGTSYTGNQGHGNTDRVALCASSTGSSCNTSATAMEAITVHLPSTNTSATMPTLTQPACSATGGNCAAVQIAESTGPKVAVFARQGATLTEAIFTTTHSGTAQYLVAGMAAGTYTVTDGSGSTSCTVATNDNTCYFESTSGATQVGSGGSSNTVTTSTAGTGSGTVTGCPTGSYLDGSTVNCTATASGGSTFAGWSGTCGLTGTTTPTSFTMPSSNCTVIATFNTSGVNYTLTVSTTTGTGTGTINITNNCNNGSQPSGTLIGPCAATPDAGSVFAGWTGTLGCTGTGTCTASLTGNSTMNAVFNLAPTSAPGVMQGIVSIQGTAIIQ